MFKSRTRLNIISIASLLVISLCVVSCDTNLIFEQHDEIENNTWHKDSVLTFNFEADSIHTKAINFSFNIRNTTSYKYRNLWLFLELNVPNQAPKIDTLNIQLMDEQGFWKENVSGGNIKESKHYYKYAQAFPPKGTYNIKLKHGMREDILEEVLSVGVRIEKMQE